MFIDDYHNIYKVNINYCQVSEFLVDMRTELRED